MTEPRHVRDANFLRFWTGQTLSQFGVRMGFVAVPVVAVQLLHATEGQLGYLNAAETLAFLVVGLPAGAWVDRWLKRRTMIVADAVRLLVALAVPLLWFGHALQMWHLYAVGLVIGVATVFFDVSYQSYVPMLVQPEEIGTANGRLESTAQLSLMAGPALGGLLLKVVSAPFVMLANAAGYLASLCFLLTTRDEEGAERAAADPAERRPLHREIAEGAGFVARHPAIRLVAASTAISNLTTTLAFTLFPIMVLRIIGLDGFTLGIVLAAGSIGGFLGALAAPRLARRVRESTLIIGGMAVAWLGGLLAPAAVAVHPRPAAAAVLVAAEMIMSAGVIVYNVTQVTMRQRLCPRRLLGRMNASIRFVVWGVMPIASLIAGWLGGALGPMPTIWLGAVAAGLAAVPLLLLPRALPREGAPLDTD